MLKHQESASTNKIWLTAILCMLPNMSFGAMLAFISVSLPYYTDINNTSGIYMDDNLSSWFVSLNQPVRMAGTLTATILNDKLGRKKSIFISAIVMIFGGTMTYFAQSYMMLMIGSQLAGFGSGLVVTPTYSLLNDVTIIKLRGTLGSLNTLTVNGGYLYGLVVGMILSMAYLPLVMIAPALTFLAFYWLLAESPVWLASKGKTDEARDVLQNLRGAKYNVDPELKEILGVVCDNKDTEKKTVLCKEFLKPVIIIIIIFFFQALAGADTISYFSMVIFKGQQIDETLMALFFQVMITMGYMISPYIMARINRRPQFIAAVISHGIGMSILGTSSFLPEHQLKPYIQLFCLCMTGLSYGLGVGPVPFVLMSEMFGVKYKSEGMAIGMAARCLMAFGQLKVFANVRSIIGIDGIFLCHSILNFCAAIFVFLVLPETRNKSMSELEDIWKSGTDLIQSKIRIEKKLELEV